MPHKRDRLARASTGLVGRSIVDGGDGSGEMDEVGEAAVGVLFGELVVVPSVGVLDDGGL